MAAARKKKEPKKRELTLDDIGCIESIYAGFAEKSYGPIGVYYDYLTDERRHAAAHFWALTRKVLEGRNVLQVDTRDWPARDEYFLYRCFGGLMQAGFKPMTDRPWCTICHCLAKKSPLQDRKGSFVVPDFFLETIGQRLGTYKMRGKMLYFFLARECLRAEATLEKTEALVEAGLKRYGKKYPSLYIQRTYDHLRPCWEVEAEVTEAVEDVMLASTVMPSRSSGWRHNPPQRFV